MGANRTAHAGKRFHVDVLDVEDLKAGELKSSWVPLLDLPSTRHLDHSTILEFSKQGVLKYMLAVLEAGGSVVSDEWNRIFPDYKFTGLEEFMTKVWAGTWKP